MSTPALLPPPEQASGGPASRATAGAVGEPAPAAGAAGPVASRATAGWFRRVLLAGGLGLVEAGLLYGGTIALLHLLHNRAGGIGPVDALVLLAWCVGLYGTAGAAAIGGAMVVVGVLGRRHSAGQRSLASQLWLASYPFHAAFWFVVSSYGLTYDESPSWVRVGWQMAAWLGLRALGVALVVAPVVWALTRLAVVLGERGRALRAVGALAAVFALAALGLGLVPAERPALPSAPALSRLDGGGKLAIVGVDGADWRVIEPLLAAGRMPNLRRMMDEGAWGPLASFPDSNSAVIWASIYTGRRPQVHGVEDFYTLRFAGMGRDLAVYPVHRTFLKEAVDRLQGVGLAELTPIDRSRVGVPLLWEVAQSQGQTIGVVDGYFYSYPAPTLSSPASFFLAYGSDGLWQQAAAEGKRPTAEQIGPYAAPPALVDELGAVLAEPDFAWQTKALSQLMARRGQPDLVNLYSHEPDALQHAAWRDYEPQRYLGVDAAAAARQDRVVPYYLALDAYLGRLRAELQPGTALMVVSDHGHSATLFHSMDTQHRHGPPGIFLLAGPGVKPGRLEQAAVLDVFPTALYLLGLPLPEDGDGRLLEEAFTGGQLQARPPRRVSSWAGLPTPAPAVPLDPARRAEELAKLRSLGYL